VTFGSHFINGTVKTFVLMKGMRFKNIITRYNLICFILIILTN